MPPATNDNPEWSIERSCRSYWSNGEVTMAVTEDIPGSIYLRLVQAAVNSGEPVAHTLARAILEYTERHHRL